MTAPKFRRFASPAAAFCLACAPSLIAGGCASPYRSDQGALFGGVTGAGVGALVGEAVHHPLAGAAIGAGVGALTGAAVGGNLDDIEARNRAEIAARLGRPVNAGAVTRDDVIAMTRAGVSEEVIATTFATRHGGPAASRRPDRLAATRSQPAHRASHADAARSAGPAGGRAAGAPAVVYGYGPPPPYYYGPPYPYYRGWYGRPY